MGSRKENSPGLIIEDDIGLYNGELTRKDRIRVPRMKSTNVSASLVRSKRNDSYTATSLDSHRMNFS
jgi:hypothetical protein